MELAESTVIEWVGEYTHDEDFFIVQVVVLPQGSLQVEVDRDGGITSDECGELNRFLLERLEALGLDMEITVSSPGLTNPMRALRQYRKSVGRQVDVLMADGLRLQGELVEAGETQFTVRYQVRERAEGQKRPVMVDRERSFGYGEPKRVTLVVGKR